MSEPLDREELIREVVKARGHLTSQELEIIVPLMSSLETSESTEPTHVQSLYRGLCELYGANVADFLCCDATGPHDVAHRFAAFYRAWTMLDTGKTARMPPPESS
jgi:hypothetical protein